MKTILCYGDSNTWGAVPITDYGRIARHKKDTRWPGVLRAALGEKYWIVEEGLPARTTMHNDPVQGDYKNGAAYLHACVESHMPLDLAVIALGTNDLKARFHLSPEEIAAGAGTLLDMIREFDLARYGRKPKVLLVCPPPLGKLELFADVFEGGLAKSKQLPRHYARAAKARGAHFLDAGTVVKTSDVDGVHWDADAHREFCAAMADKVREIFG